MSTPNRTQNSEKSFPEPLIFGTVFTNEKFVPIRAEIWSMFNKVQVVELAILTWILLNSKYEFMLPHHRSNLGCQSITICFPTPRNFFIF